MRKLLPIVLIAFLLSSCTLFESLVPKPIGYVPASTIQGWEIIEEAAFSTEDGEGVEYTLKDEQTIDFGAISYISLPGATTYSAPQAADDACVTSSDEDGLYVYVTCTYKPVNNEFSMVIYGEPIALLFKFRRILNSNIIYETSYVPP